MRLCLLVVFFWGTFAGAQNLENLPQIFLDTPDAHPIGDATTSVHIRIQQGEHFEELTGRARVRGSTSRHFPKKQYSLKLQSSPGSDSFFPFAEEKSWALNGEFRDKSLLRDTLAYTWTRQLGRYAPQTRYCELTMNGDYRGVYVLIEKIDRKRAGIPSWKKGGFLAEFQGRGKKGQVFRTARGTPLNIVYPSAGIFFSEQGQPLREQVLERLNLIEARLEQRESLDGLVDWESLADFFVIQELFNNIDAYRRSHFIHFDAQGKLAAGPVWDFDQAAANMTLNDAPSYKGWRIDHTFDPLMPIMPWWKKFKRYPEFQEHLQKRWAELRQSTLSDVSIQNTLRALSEHLIQTGAAQRNFARWKILGIPDRLFYFLLDPPPWPRRYEGEVDFLENWLLKRAHWIDDHVDSLST